MRNYSYCEHCNESRSNTYAALDVGETVYLVVCQSCYVKLQNYFITSWLGTLINDKIQDVIEKVKL